MITIVFAVTLTNHVSNFAMKFNLYAHCKIKMRRRNKQLNHKMFCHFTCHVHLHLMIIDSQVTSNLQKPLRGGSLILEEQFNINGVFRYSIITIQKHLEHYIVSEIYSMECAMIFICKKRKIAYHTNSRSNEM